MIIGPIDEHLLWLARLGEVVFDEKNHINCKQRDYFVKALFNQGISEVDSNLIKAKFFYWLLANQSHVFLHGEQDCNDLIRRTAELWREAQDKTIEKAEWMSTYADVHTYVITAWQIENRAKKNKVATEIAEETIKLNTLTEYEEMFAHRLRSFNISWEFYKKMADKLLDLTEEARCGTLRNERIMSYVEPA